MRQKITWPYRRVRGPHVAKRTRLVLSVPAWLRWWLFGAVTGIALLWVMIFDSIVFPLALVVLVVLVVRSPERAALGGGALIPTGVWFLYGLRAAVERCAEIDRPQSIGLLFYLRGQRAGDRHGLIRRGRYRPYCVRGFAPSVAAGFSRSVRCGAHTSMT